MMYVCVVLCVYVVSAAAVSCSSCMCVWCAAHVYICVYICVCMYLCTMIVWCYVSMYVCMMLCMWLAAAVVYVLIGCINVLICISYMIVSIMLCISYMYQWCYVLNVYDCIYCIVLYCINDVHCIYCIVMYLFVSCMMYVWCMYLCMCISIYNLNTLTLYLNT